MEMWDKVQMNFFQLEINSFSYCTLNPSFTRIVPEAFKK